MGVDHECDKEVCNLSDEDIHKGIEPNLTRQLAMALYNRGLDASDRYILSAEHTEQDIDATVEALEAALAELREERII